MADNTNQELINALQQIFATQADLRAIADYQRKIVDSLSELSASHRAVHDHVRNLTDSHNQNQNNTTTLLHARQSLELLLHNLEQAHNQTRGELNRAMQTINQAQQDIRRITQLDQRVTKLERDFVKLEHDEKEEDRKVQQQEIRIRKLEQSNR